MRYLKIISSIFFAVLVSAVFMFGCQPNQQKNNIKATIQNVEHHFAPDSRVNRFDVRAEFHSDSLILTGTTTSSDAKAALIDSLSDLNVTIADHIDVLPAKELGDKVFGLVNFSAINMRTRPSNGASMATQTLLGMPLDLLKRRGGWYLVRTPNDYIAWAKTSNVVPVDKSTYNEWKNARKVIYLNTYGFAYQSPSRRADHVTDLVAGDILELQGNQGNFYKVRYPDGRTGYIAKKEAKLFKNWDQNHQLTHQSLISVAKTMLGVPYLWGGTSTKGVDCSGFTHTIYYMNGKIIPRDASQQVEAGVLIDSTKDWNNLQVGDLLFFGRPATDSTSRHVSHVAMWIGNGEYIQSSGYVRITSMDSTASNFGAYNLHRYLQARRYIGNWKGNITNIGKMYQKVEDADAGSS